jgi:hypothetical protein
MNPGAEERKRQGDRSDVRQELSSLRKEPDPARAFASGRAPALHARECLTTPVLAIPSISPMRGGMRPLSVGRLSGAFHPAMDDYHPIILLFCQEISQKNFSKSRCRRYLE